MSSTIFSNSGTEVKTLKDQLSLNDTAKIRTGTDDPRSVAKEGAQGSIYLQTGSSGGKVFKKLDSGTSTNWSEVGSGAGGINYITNPDAEAGTTGWVAYADAAGAIPVDGTGGSPTVTITTSASSPLRGLNSFLLTKDAANRQGEGVGCAFTIDTADRAEVIAVEIDYAISSGTFVAGTSSDLKVFIYDVTNAQLITPVSNQFDSNTTGKYKGLFQSASNSSSYRLIVHCATTSSSAYVFKFDNVRVGPQQVLFGAPVTDFRSYTLTIGATTTPPAPGTVTVNNAQWRRVGDCMEIRYDFLQTVAGTAGTGGYLFPIPSGYTIDLAKVDGEGGYNACVGSAIARAGTTAGTGTVNVFNSTNLAINVFASSGSTFATVPGPIGSTYYALTFADIEWSFTALVPIVGWSSQVQMSDSSETRVVAARYTSNAGQSIATATVTIVDFEDKDYDTHSLVTTGGSWKLTASSPGYYRVSARVGWSTINTGNNYETFLYKNGALYSRLTSQGDNATVLHVDTVQLNPGDFVDVRCRQDTGGSVALSSTSTDTSVAIERISGPSAIAANELVAAHAVLTADQTIASGATDIVVFNNDLTNGGFDTHAFFDTATGRATIPVSGTFLISTTIIANATAANWSVIIYKNATAMKALGRDDATSLFQMGGSVLQRLVAGDIIDVRVTKSGGGSVVANGTSDSLASTVSIHRVGF